MLQYKIYPKVYNVVYTLTVLLVFLEKKHIKQVVLKKGCLIIIFKGRKNEKR